MKIRIVFIGIILIFLSSCMSKRPSLIKHSLAVLSPEIVKNTCAEEVPFITVWVHGTRLTPAMVCKNFFAAPEGLVKAADFDPKCHLHTIARSLSEVDSAHYPFEHFYLFGWSGALDFNARKQAAADLLASLKKVVHDFEEKYGRTPKIRIITHSHGGNVALNLVCVADKENIVIDELILLACPVQCATMEYLKDPMFKNIYSLYSATDLLQVIDPQGVYSHEGPRPLFSERRFEAQKNLVQARIRMNKHSMLHVNFLLTSFIRVLPQVIDEMNSWHKKDSGGEHVLSISA